MSENNVSSTISQLVSDAAQGRCKGASAAHQISESVTTHKPTTLASELYSLWVDIIDAAGDDGGHTQQGLVDLVVDLSQLPEVKDKRGNVVEVHRGVVWRDLPMFAWEINSVWNSFSLPESEPARSTAITQYTNKIRFTSNLLSTPHQLFTPFRMQILWTFRPIESPTPSIRNLDVYVRAIATVISVLGSQISTWDDDYKQTNPNAGRPGSGGPLWEGKEGFNAERYELWKGRLSEISRDEGLDWEVRKLAGQAERGM